VRVLAALHGVYAYVLYHAGGDLDESLRYGCEATRLAEQTEDQGLQLAERAVLAFASLFAGRLAEGIEVCDTACQRLPGDPALGAEFTGFSPFLAILIVQSWTLCRLGRLKEAAAVCERAETLARAHGDNETLLFLQMPRIELDVIFANAAALRDHARCAMEAGEKTATPEARLAGLIALGIAHLLNEQLGEAVAVLEETISTIVSGVVRGYEGIARTWLAEALLECGDLDPAEHEAQAAVAATHAQHARCDEIRANLALAHTQLWRADAQALARAEQALVRAQELIDETGARLYQPQVHECRAHLARLRGNARAARHELGAAQKLYAGMGATAQVERLAKEIDGCEPQALLDQPGAKS
jgi:hypothetical protein